jgi:hypothetical protein
MCGCAELTRYHRSLWMRLFKGSQLLRCRQCRSTILLLRDPNASEDTDTDADSEVDVAATTPSERY